MLCLRHSHSVFFWLSVLRCVYVSIDGRRGSTTNMKYESDRMVSMFMLFNFIIAATAVAVDPREPRAHSFHPTLSPVFFFFNSFDLDWSLAMWRLPCQNTIFHYFFSVSILFPSLSLSRCIPGCALKWINSIASNVGCCWCRLLFEPMELNTHRTRFACKYCF